MVSALGNEIAAALRPGPRRVHNPSRQIAALAAVVSLRLAVHGHAHLALQDDVSRFRAVGMLAILHIGTVFPDVEMRIALKNQLFGEVFLFHSPNFNAFLSNMTNSSN